MDQDIKLTQVMSFAKKEMTETAFSQQSLIGAGEGEKQEERGGGKLGLACKTNKKYHLSRIK